MGAMSPDRSRLTGTLIVLVAAALFATLGVFSRVAYAAGLSPFAFVAWRATIGAIGIWSVATWMHGRGWPIMPFAAMDPRTRSSLLVAIVVGTALNLSIFLAFQTTTLALALLGFYTYPAMVAAASVLLGRERLDAPRVLALLLAITGMAAVVLGGSDIPAAESSTALDVAPAVGSVGIGVALALVAALCQAIFVLVSRGYAAVPTHQAMATILAGTAVLATVVSVAVAGPGSVGLPLGSPELLGLLVVVGLFAAALPSTLFLTGIRRIGGVRTGILMLFEPVVGVALGAAFLAEAVTPLQVAGGVTILLAAALVQRTGAAPDEAALVPLPGGP